MNREEARRILQVCRPDGQDDTERDFAEALAAARRDPELGRLLAEQQSFDRTVAAGLKSDPIPPQLKANILASNRALRRPWWRPQQPMRLALAASLIGLLVCVQALKTRAPMHFKEVRREMIEGAWEGNEHLDFVGGDFARARSYFIRNGIEADFKVPTSLKDFSLIGCRVLDCGDHKVGLICLAAGMHHMHLFVMDRVQTSDAPSETAPQFEECHGWKTISWSRGNTTYVVSGMNYISFVRKFRKGGHWTWAG